MMRFHTLNASRFMSDEGCKIIFQGFGTVQAGRLEGPVVAHAASDPSPFYSSTHTATATPASCVRLKNAALAPNVSSFSFALPCNA